MKATTLISTLLVAAAVGVGCATHALAADVVAKPTVAELLQRIEALEKALGEVRRDGAPCAAEPVAAESKTGRGIVARPIARTAEASPAAASVAITAGYDKGFFLASADGANKLTLGGMVQADSRIFPDDNNGEDTNQFVLRRARIDLQGTIARRFRFRLLEEFTNTRISPLDAYIDVDFAPWAQLRGGRFKTPFGIERLQGAAHMVFMERGLTNNLVPNRDLGLQLGGNLSHGKLSYQLAVLNGAPDGGSSEGDSNDSYDVAGRVFVKPYLGNQYSPLRGAGFGLAATYGYEQGSPTSSQLPFFQTSAQSRFFTYVSSSPATAAGTTVANGEHYRLSPQATWYEGSFGFLGDYVYSAQNLQIGATQGMVRNQAWQLQTSYILTGEKASYDGFDPNSPFRFGEAGWGAWEAALRWASLDVDPDAFSRGFSNPAASARHADALGLALNWYLSRNVSFNLNYERTMFGGGAPIGNREAEDAVLTRMELVF